MKDLLQTGKIRELKNSLNTAYVLEDNTLFNMTGYKVLKSQEKNGFIKCSKVLYNGNVKLLYFTAEKKNLKNMMPLIDTDTFIIIISNVLKSVIDTKNNGFLNCFNLDLSFDKIFVDTYTNAVSFIYLPINNNSNDILSFENDLRTDLIKIITSTPALSNPKMHNVSAMLSNGSLSLEELYKGIVSEMNATPLKTSGQVMPSSDIELNDDVFKQPAMKFISIDPKNPLSLVVDSREYIIGKNPSKVNGVISFNNAIGRVHCRFIYKNDSYFIIDGDGTKRSTNGTYVNGTRLQNIQPYPVKNGDIIRLANSDFAIQI